MRMVTKFSAIITLAFLKIGCVTASQQQIQDNESRWMQKAKYQAQFLLSCDKVRYKVLDRNSIDISSSRVDALSIVGFAGCGQRVTFRLLDREGIACDAFVPYFSEDICEWKQNSSVTSQLLSVGRRASSD